MSWKVINGDAYAELPGLEPKLVYVTDHPFGTGWVKGKGRRGEFKPQRERQAWDVFSTAWVRLLNQPNQIAVITPNSRLEDTRAALSPATGWYVKTNPRPKGPDRDPIVFLHPPDAPEPWEFRAYNGDTEFHPCQKPLELMRWLVRLVSEPGDTIVDPFAGSFTTGVACAIEGRNFIGIEQSEEYCRIGEAWMKRASGEWAEMPKVKRRLADTPLLDAITA
jgi:hypothetical protein